MADVTLPQLGETVTEGTITRWFKNVGDVVKADEPLFEVSTDKVDTEVPSPIAGTLTEIRVPAGDTVPVGTVIAVVGAASGAAAPAPAPAPAPVVAAPVPAVATPAPAVEPVDFGKPPPEEPEQAITKLSPPPQPIPNLPPQGDNVVPFRRPGKQGKLPVPKVGSANDTDGGGAGGFQRIAEMKKIERRLTVSLRNWTKKGLL